MKLEKSRSGWRSKWNVQFGSWDYGIADGGKNEVWARWWWAVIWVRERHANNISLNVFIFYYSYKAKGANAVDPTGKPDSSEFLNVAKDDAIAWPQQARRSYPSTVNARMESTITPFVRKSLEVNTTLFQIFEEKLGLPAGAITERHKLEEFSGSEARLIRTSPSPSGKEPVVGIGAHSDFGSLVCTLTPIG